MAVNRLCAYVVSVVEREFFPNSGVIKSNGILKLRAFKTQKQAKRIGFRSQDQLKD